MEGHDSCLTVHSNTTDQEVATAIAGGIVGRGSFPSLEFIQTSEANTLKLAQRSSKVVTILGVHFI